MHSTPLIEMESRILAEILRAGLANSADTNRDLSAGAQPEGSLAARKDLCGELRTNRRWISTRQLSQYLCCHPETVRKQVKFDGLPARKMRGRWKYYPPLVAEWLEPKLGTIIPMPRAPASIHADAVFSLEKCADFHRSGVYREMRHEPK